MKRNTVLFMLESPLQIMGAISIALSLKESSTAYAVINPTFTHAEEYVERLSRCDVFESVILLDSTYANMKRPTLISALRSDSFRKERLNAAYEGLRDMQFDVLFCPGPVTLALDLKAFYARNGYTVLIDDGTGSHYGKIIKAFSCLDDVANEDTLEFDSGEKLRLYCKKLFRAATGNRYLMNIREVMLFNPTEMERNLFKNVDVDSISIDGDSFRDCVARVFLPEIDSAPDLHGRFVFMGYPDNVGKDYKQAETLAVQDLYSALGDRLLYRAHPRRVDFSDLPSGLEIDASGRLWEAMWACGLCGEDSVLMGFGSTALITPKVIFDKEPRVVFLHEVYFKPDSHIINTRIASQEMLRRYTNGDKVLIPSDGTHLASALRGLMSELLALSWA